jgi:hypothetical protein
MTPDPQKGHWLLPNLCIGESEAWQLLGTRGHGHLGCILMFCGSLDTFIGLWPNDGPRPCHAILGQCDLGSLTHCPGIANNQHGPLEFPVPPHHDLPTLTRILDPPRTAHVAISDFLRGPANPKNCVDASLQGGHRAPHPPECETSVAVMTVTPTGFDHEGSQCPGEPLDEPHSCCPGQGAH